MTADPAVDDRGAQPVPSPTELAGLSAGFKHAKTLALRSPADMAVFCEPTFVRRPHVEVISGELAKLATGETTHLMIRTPPQVGKTTLAAVWGVFWWLARHPDQRCIIGSYSSELAVARGRSIRTLVDAHGWRFDLTRNYGEGSVSNWGLETGGGVRCAGVGAGLTGFPANGLAVIDDPHKDRAEAESKPIRDYVGDWYSASFLSRLAPGTPQLIIMTPWHEDDLSHRRLKIDGRVEEGGLWKVVDLPAFARLNDPMGREPGAPLTHPAIEPHDTAALVEFWENRRKATSARDWTSLYDLDPKPMTAALVTEDMIELRTHNPLPAKPRRAVVGVDPSGGGRDNAGIVGGFLGTDGRAYATHDYSITGPSEVWGRRVAELAGDIDADVIVFEPNYGRDQARVVINAGWREAREAAAARNVIARAEGSPLDKRFNRPPPLVKMAPWAKVNKQLRAEPAAQQVNHDHARFAVGLPELKRQLVSWRPTDKDSPGNLDAWVYLEYELLPMDNEPDQAHVAAATPLPGTTKPVSGALTPGVPGMPGSAGVPSGVNVVPSQGDLRSRRPATPGARRQSGWGPRAPG